jgi:hypothetical protein
VSEWISCRDSLPPWRKWVMVSSERNKFIAKRIGIVCDHWKMRSGLTEWLSTYDYWRELDDGS